MPVRALSTFWKVFDEPALTLNNTSKEPAFDPRPWVREYWTSLGLERGRGREQGKEWSRCAAAVGPTHGGRDQVIRAPQSEQS